ncbi:hypothetical protein Cadr_000007408 [Camelus dromedarius]|uniref:Uncharacterized protein n=1 Tax=Camelus dromedarius TaxID=9838 RepID=A0A5N4E527_CAMDR|nr:hypothetical protein Cadr_000007408 [Camelus dromedarius]KAB1278391.1 hypothetical protein Cadr_000007408 [Camelus dromedarius]
MRPVKSSTTMERKEKTTHTQPATLLSPSPQELTGDVMRDPRREKQQQPRQWRHRRFLPFVKIVISFLRPRVKASHHQSIYTFRFY